MTGIVELYGHNVADAVQDWRSIVGRQWCPFLERKCVKVRKSQPNISIGTCSVLYGKTKRPIVICPYRLLERGQVFTDCLHLLTVHEPGNELHIVPEVSVPGGSVDYFLASVKDRKVKDFVGIEMQTLDTTGTVWPTRQRSLREMGFYVLKRDADSTKTYGMNWKMTGKTTLIQMHHKIRTFEAVNKHLVLVIQDFLLEYLRAAFQFSHLADARRGDPMHLHAYTMTPEGCESLRLALKSRLSTDSEGIAVCLGLQAEAKMDLNRIVAQIESKISEDTLFRLG